jgi:hypothetical protein
MSKPEVYKLVDLPKGTIFYFPYSAHTGAYIKEDGKSYRQAGFWLGGKDENGDRKKYPFVVKNDLNLTVECYLCEADEDGKRIIPPPYEHIPFTEWGKWNGNSPLPIDWSFYGKRIEWQGAKLTIRKTRSGGGTHYFKVTLDGGEWCSDRALMMLCDGSTPTETGHPGHFGGGVAKRGNEADVQVYYD